MIDYHNFWTPEQIAILRSLAGKKCGREIAPLVGHTRGATLKKMSTLGLEGFNPGRQGRWTEEQWAALQIVKPGISARRWAAQHGLGEEAVRHWARKLGIKFQSASRWRDTEDRLRELAKTCTVREAAATVGRTVRATEAKGRELGIKFVPIKRISKRKPVICPKPQWSLAEDDALRGFRGKTAVQASATIGRTVRAVQNRARRLGVKLASSDRKVAVPVIVQRLKLVPKPKPVRPYVSPIEYCRQCGAPVSNWQQHQARMGHRRYA